MQAATGPACHTIRQTIDRFGIRPGREALPNVGTSSDESAEEETESDLSAAVRAREARTTPSGEPGWWNAFEEGDFARAAELLEQSLKSAEADDVRRRFQ